MTTSDGASSKQTETPRAEEIIAAVYGRMTQLRSQGKVATAVVLPVDLYRTIQAYRRLLGDAPQGLPDYLGKYDLFGVPIYTDGGQTIVIKSRSAEHGNESKPSG